MPNFVLSPPTVVTTGTFSLEASQTTILPGEPIGIRIVPESESGTGFSGVDPYRDVLYIMDFDDDAAVFDLASTPYGDTTARAAFVRNGTKAWTTPGVKTVTVSVYKGGYELIAEETIAITVLDPENTSDIVWDVSIYHDGQANWTGMPADNGTTIRRTSTHAEARTWSTMWSAGDNARIVLADNGDMDLDVASGSINLANGNGIVYIMNESLGASGTLPVWDDTSSSTSSVFTDGSTSTTRTARIVLGGFDLQLNFDPVDASGNQRNIIDPAFIQESGAHDNHLGLFRFKASGFFNGISTGGNNIGTATADAYRFFYDVDMGNHYDYCHFHGTGRLWAGMNGCSMLPHPKTLIGDGKNAGDYMANHALATRWQNAWAASTVNSYLGAAAGWTSVNADTSMQHTQRYVPHNTGSDSPEYILSQNKTVGKFMFNIVDPNAQDLVEPIATMVDMCFHVGTRQTRHMIEVGVGGNYVRNCIMYIPNVDTDAQATIGLGFMKFGDDNNPPAGVQKESYVEFNTILSDRDGSDGGTDNWDTIVDSGWTGETVNVGNNVIDVSGHDNSASFPSQGTLSRSGLLKPLTSATAIIDAVTTGWRPVNDFEGNIRAKDGVGSTNIGAHDTADAVDAGIPPPANTVAPTAPYAVPGHSEDFIMPHGTWTNLTDTAQLGPLGAYLWDQRWYVDGTEAGLEGTRYDRDTYGGSGQELEGEVGYAGMGGQSVTYVRTSATVTL